MCNSNIFFHNGGKLRNLANVKDLYYRNSCLSLKLQFLQVLALFAVLIGVILKMDSGVIRAGIKKDDKVFMFIISHVYIIGNQPEFHATST